MDGPRRGIKKIVAGGQFNIAISECPGTCYMWGQYTSSKEANMYPKPIMDLSGWAIRSIGCSGKGWMVAADDSVIGCAPSPCFGELVSTINYLWEDKLKKFTKFWGVLIVSIIIILYI